MAEAQDTRSAVLVRAGIDRFDQLRNVGPNSLQYKIVGRDTGDRLFIFELTNTRRGGPPRHFHPAQEEWFYVLEGKYLVEIGADRIQLMPGDSLLAPRNVPHVWAYVGDAQGRMLVGFQPVGRMESYFAQVSKQPDLQRDEAVLRAHGMELVGPPLTVE